MILSSINKVAFSIGSLTVEWYGIILTSAMIIGLIYIMHEAPRINLTSDDALELFLWVIPLAVIFSRLLYILPRADEYFPWNSWDAFVNAWAIWKGGITIIGGILGGILGGIIFWLKNRKKKKVSFGQLVDLVIPVLLLAQSIGRWGNFINQEAFGVAITNPQWQWFPFAVYIDNAAGFANGWYAATFFYESLFNLCGAVLFFFIWRKNKKYPGILGFGYFAWYFFIRAMMEYIRLDAVPITQVACFILFPLAILGGALYIILKNRRDKAKPQNQEAAVCGKAQTDETEEKNCGTKNAEEEKPKAEKPETKKTDGVKAAKKSAEKTNNLKKDK